ncbi:MAG: sirohydrochlorin cobaltochelatase, partial [Proteobacteria bacterium]|nr:sirohydrochlorin cobaltochelatase [Pseudomonadota bacterium]
MKIKHLSVIPVVLMVFFLTANAFAGGHGHNRPMKKGILLVAFGSSMPEAWVSFENIDKKAKAAFPDVP